MKIAAGILGIIGGVFGSIAAFVTLFLGGVVGTLEAEGGNVIIGLGWGGLLFSIVSIVFGALAFSKLKVAGYGLVISSILGGILGGTLVGICMIFPLVGGILAFVESRKEKNSESKVSERETLHATETKETAKNTTLIHSDGNRATKEEEMANIMQDKETLWFYEINGERKGPVSATEITNLLNTEVISNESRVWQKGMANWITISKTQFAKTCDVPPPLTGKAIKNAEDYGLKKKLSILNVHKVKKPELYGGFNYWIYKLLTILSAAWGIGLILYLANHKSTSVVKKYQAKSFLLYAAIGFILMLGWIVTEGMEENKFDVKQIGQAKVEETGKDTISTIIEGVYDGTLISQESGDKGGSVITIRKTKSGYLAKWDRFEGGEEPTNIASNLPVTVSGNTVSFFVQGTLWKSTLNENGMVGADGTVYKRKGNQ